MNISGLKALALAIDGLIRARKVYIHEITTQMDTPAQSQSNEKRVFRLLHGVAFDFTQVAAMLLTLVPQHETFELVLDCTMEVWGAALPCAYTPLGDSHTALLVSVGATRQLGQHGAASHY